MDFRLIARQQVNTTYSDDDGDDSSFNESIITNVLEDFDEGIQVLEELSERQLISADEGMRRKLLLQSYLEYQQYSDDDEFQTTDICSRILKKMCEIWSKLRQWAYYTEQVD